MDKAVWDDETMEIFVNACVEQVYKKERRGQAFSKKAWGIIVSTFNAKTGKDYDRKKLKNRLDILKKDFKTWDSLIKETGVGIDPVTKKVMATNEWWQRKLQEKPAYRKFRHTGLKFENELRIIFKDAMASGEDVVVPTVTQPQTQQEDEEEDGYRPTMDEEEGSGDSEDDMFGAIDGTHIKCVITGANRERYIGRKGYPTQNVMAVCDWDMCFTFVMAGWEGTAHDARVFESAVSNPSYNFPHPPAGKYYLVDAGYPTQLGYLGPYRRERYHLPEFSRQPGFRNANKTFNYYHSSLRSTIERTFGVWKNRFQLLQNMRKYSYQTQVRIVCATMALHNFIRRNDIGDEVFRQGEAGNLVDVENNSVAEQSSTTNYGRRSSSEMIQIRDSIRNQIVRHM